jgi:hypothetical protein
MKQIGIAWALAVFLSSAIGAEIKGTVGYWSFDEAAGDVARDASGNGNDGNIQGAKFVKSPKGFALKFDGEDDFVECEANKSLQQLELAGTIELWVKPEELQGGLVNWSTGSGWVDQRLVMAFRTHEDGSAEFISRASDGSGQGKRFRGQDLKMPEKGAWNHVALTFDGGTITFHLDGRMLRAYSQQYARAVLEGVPLWIGRCQGLGKGFFKGTMDELRLYSRVLSDEEILAHYKEGAAAFGKDTSTFERPEIRIEVLPEPGWIAVEADYGLMRPLPEGASVEAQILDAQGAETLSRKVEAIHIPRTVTNVILDVRALQPGNYLIRAGIVGADRRPAGETVQTPVSWPGQSEAFKGVRILNNLVWELLNVQPGLVEGEQVYTFTSPKSRWLHVATAVDAGKGVRLSVEPGSKARDIIVFEAGEKGSKEAMCFLPAGASKLILQADGPCDIQSIVARSIPELWYHEFGGGPSPGQFHSDSDEFMEKHVIANVNTFALSGGLVAARPPILQKNLLTPRRWLVNFVMKGLDYFGEAYALSSSQEVYDYVSGLRGLNDPDIDGVCGDELLGGSDPGFPWYTDAIRMLEASPKFKDKLFYAYCTNIYGGDQGRKLVKTIIDAGGTLVWERYLKTMSSESAALEFMREHLVLNARQYRELCPGSIEHITVLVGYYTLPGGHLENSTPSINFKTHLDMQFNIVANDPVFWGAYGLGGYHSSYSNEETIRWMVRLFRHYGIEGSTEPATDEPYILPHIENPDFIHGTEGWTLDPVEAGSIRPIFKRGWGFLQSRIGRTEGDTALLTVRSARRPNRFSQEIKDLEPGRLYSFYMFSGDGKDMSKREQHAVRIHFENATVIPEKGYTFVHPNRESFPPYDKAATAWMNYHYRVFRANGNSARLVISDWFNDVEPGGPIGQELMYNFISVQPYFSEE